MKSVTIGFVTRTTSEDLRTGFYAVLFAATVAMLMLVAWLAASPLS
jgi:hypothetical protein